MNSTFMFGEDNFGPSEDFSLYYHQTGGTLPSAQINTLIRSVYAYLNERYPDAHYRHNFPSIENAIDQTTTHKLHSDEIAKVIDTFAFHERGQIPQAYASVLHKLSERFQLALVIDIWSPKALWLELFETSGISTLFAAASFSSDHGMIKPSPKPFELLVLQLGIKKEQALVVGDSIRRDLGGATAAGIDCVLVGGAEHDDALGCYDNLLTFNEAL